MKFLVICDYRENFKNYATPEESKQYNDHPNMKNIAEIITAIRELGHECEYFGGIPELIHAVDSKQRFENRVFLNFTDGMDENYSRVQAPALLDILKVPYSGSGVFSSVLMNNKHFCKMALKDTNICMPRSCLVNSSLPLDTELFSDWDFPLFVKPNCEGSSLGIQETNVCHNRNDLINESSRLLSLFEEVIIEEYVHGTDVTNYLIGINNSYIINDVISAELFDKSPYAIYGIKEKQNKLRSLFLNEEYLPSNIVKQIQEQSICIAQTIGANDICRIDYRVNLTTSKIYFIEANSAPRFSSSSEIGFIAEKRQLSFKTMVQFLLDTVLERIV